MSKSATRLSMSHSIFGAPSRALFNTATFTERSCQTFSVPEDKQTQIKQGNYFSFRAVTY